MHCVETAFFGLLYGIIYIALIKLREAHLWLLLAIIVSECFFLTFHGGIWLDSLRYILILKAYFSEIGEVEAEYDQIGGQFHDEKGAHVERRHHEVAFTEEGLNFGLILIGVREWIKAHHCVDGSVSSDIYQVADREWNQSDEQVSLFPSECSIFHTIAEALLHLPCQRLINQKQLNAKQSKQDQLRYCPQRLRDEGKNGA